jgi:hypothetical protein
VPFVKGQRICNACNAAVVAEYRARKAGKLPPDPAKPRGRPPRRQDFTPEAEPEEQEPSPPTGSDLTQAMASPATRLQFMLERHQRSIERFDRDRLQLEKRIQAAEREGIAADVKDYTKMRQSLTVSAAEYDLKMSKELQVWQEFAAEEDSDTPVSFVLNHVAGIPADVVVGCVNDALQVKAEL